MKVNINFVCKKKKNKFVFNENTNQFCLLKKSNLHLMKIQISFECFENQIWKIQTNFYFKKIFDN